MWIFHYIQRTVALISNFNRSQKIILQLLADGIIICTSFIAALLLRLGHDIVTVPTNTWFAAAIATLATLVVIGTLGLYRALIRYISFKYLSQLALVLMLPSCLLYALGPLLSVSIPNTLPPIFYLVSLVAIFTIRLIVGYLLTTNRGKDVTSVAIYGTGDNGRQLLNAIFQHRGYRPRLILDIDRALVGSQILGLPVYHPEQLPELIKKHSLQEILIPDDLMSGQGHLELRKNLYESSIQIKTIPSIDDILTGRTKLNDLQDLDISELLKRDAVEPNYEIIQQHVSEKALLITGAGGSIGSEICRQIFKFNPKRMILLDLSEPALYAIGQEIENQAKLIGRSVSITLILGSIQNEDLIRDLLTSQSIDAIYHCAAYKHVPMLECNIVEGMRNNVLGTYILSKTAAHHGIKHLILVSSDKAVRPTNIMGASKRVSELICLSLANQFTDTKFSIVRFGNVMGSSGSVIPLFKKQIEDGGPLTVTHPEVTRYFMTIQEASQLVIQASMISKGGDLLILDMGEPIKILDLAKRMAHLSGLKASMPQCRTKIDSQDEIAIKIVGLRPGEKLHEELTIDSKVLPSQHPKIFVEDTKPIEQGRLETLIHEIVVAIENGNILKICELLRAKEVGFSHAIGNSEASLGVNQK